MKEHHDMMIHHSMKRRCFVHDYKGRSIYLITLEVVGRRRLLGEMRPDRLTPAAPDSVSVAGRPSGEGRLMIETSLFELRCGETDPATTGVGRRITRAECLALNAIVADLCGGKASEIVYHGI